MKMRKQRPLFVVTMFTWLMLLSGVHAGELADFDGNPKAISDYSGKGKWLVVMIWASDCHVCNRRLTPMWISILPIPMKMPRC